MRSLPLCFTCASRSSPLLVLPVAAVGWALVFVVAAVASGAMVASAAVGWALVFSFVAAVGCSDVVAAVGRMDAPDCVGCSALPPVPPLPHATNSASSAAINETTDT